ncbi:MAG: hypothetical protein HHJ11_09880 [Phycicoccus sp.]|nr:hypothetical protein [Phycicoccus sp.]NMM33835.1 hypothetical protein [Phycicoccus sp.]
MAQQEDLQQALAESVGCSLPADRAAGPEAVLTWGIPFAPLIILQAAERRP